MVVVLRIDSCVAYFEAQTVRCGVDYGDNQCHLALVCELDRITQQVDQHLVQLTALAENHIGDIRGEFGIQLQTFFFGVDSQQRCGFRAQRCTLSR